MSRMVANVGFHHETQLLVRISGGALRSRSCHIRISALHRVQHNVKEQTLL